MSNIQVQDSTTNTITQVINNKYKHFKTLVLKLKPNTCRSDELDGFVDQMIDDLHNTLLSNSNDLRERVKQARPDSNDGRYSEKVIIYKELLEQMIVLIQKLENIISQTLDEYHILIEQLWNDISNNNGQNIHYLLAKHESSMKDMKNLDYDCFSFQK